MVNISCELEKTVSSSIADRVLYKCQLNQVDGEYYWCSTIFIVNFCLFALKIIDRKVLKSATILADLPVFSFSCIQFCLTYFDVWFLIWLSVLLCIFGEFTYLSYSAYFIPESTLDLLCLKLAYSLQLSLLLTCCIFIYFSSLYFWTYNFFNRQYIVNCLVLFALTKSVF